jgi:perosamine synthetase
VRRGIDTNPTKSIRLSMTDIPLSQPQITDAEIAAVTGVLQSGHLSNGPQQARFEQLVADRAQRRHGIAVSSGTAALHLVLAALDLKPGDQIITTPFSFIASANCILYVGATPVFVDIDPHSLNMDPSKVEAAITDRTKAIIAVETFGSTKHMHRIAQIAGAHEIPLIEDCCDALGGAEHGRPVGSFGRAGVFGFCSNKQITTGEGGMIVTDDDRMADVCRSLRNQGRTALVEADADDDGNMGVPERSYERQGYNYRLNELACALGVAQMDRLDQILTTRRRIAGMYMQRLMDCQDIVLPNVESADEMSWLVFVVHLSDLFGRVERDRIITGMRRHDVGAGSYFPCIHLQPFYRKRFNFEQGAFPVAEYVAQRTIALPFFNRMDETHVELVCHTMKVMIQREKLLKDKA